MTTPLRALLVDDEPLARLALRQALTPHPDVEIVGECGDGAKALEAVAALRPDVLFLDVQMPVLGGFELLLRLQEAPVPLPLVVFVTAHDRHALEAFEAQAMDYLLKPLDQCRVDRAVERVRAQARGRAAGERPLARLAVRHGDRIRFVSDAEIDWAEADGNYVALHVGGATFLHREALSRLASRLDPSRFARIHRGTLVNVERVREVRPLPYGDAEVVLRSGERLALSRRYRSRAGPVLGI